MSPDYDALIVGAGPAGCAAAFDLAHAGRRVLLLDKRSFPRHKACACGLTRKTLKALRYSVEPVIERACRDVVLQEAGPAFLTGRRTADKSCEVRVRLRNPFCAMAVRERFDAFCLQQTLATGAELRKIEGIIALRELPTHIELEIGLPGGGTETLRAPVLIGADGSNGQMRRLAAGIASQRSLATPHSRELSSRTLSLAMGEESAFPTSAEATAAAIPAEPAWYARGFALEATVPYPALPAQLPGGDRPLDLVFDFSPIAGGYGWLFPKGDHINIGVGGFVPQDPQAAAAGIPDMRYETVTRQLLAEYTRAKLGIDLAALPAAHVSGQHLGLGGHAYVPEGRILLVGDAAGLVDPLTGEGIHSAIISGQAAAAAILEALPNPHSRHSHPRDSSPRDSSPRDSSPRDTHSRGLSSRPERAPFHVSSRSEARSAGPERSAASETQLLATSYARHLQPLQETLAFSQRAARSFYREPERGFKVMRTPLLRNLVLKTYADGLPTTRLLTSLARRVA